MTDPAATILAELTAAGGEFEVVSEDGRPPTFAHRRASLRAWLDDSVAFGDRDYLVQGDERITYAQFFPRVAELASILTDEYGVEPGDRVAILAANSPTWITAFWAASSLGAVVAAGNAWWTPREAAQSLQRADPKVVVADERRAPLVGGLPVLRTESLRENLGRHASASMSLVDIDEDAPAVIVYTSGTTGTPKGAVHSHRGLLAIIEYHRMMDAYGAAMAAAFGMPARTEPRRFLMSMPLFHIASLHNLAIPRLATGDSVIIDRGAFDPDRVLSLIERERVTNWAVVPTMAHRIADRASSYDLSSLSALSINSAPSAPALKDRVRAAVPSVAASIIDSYGLTESGTAATLAGPVDLAVAPTSVGRPVASVVVEIRDEDGKVVAEGEDGEIWIRSQFSMIGYWNDADATVRAMPGDGWLRTGDIGFMRDGRLYMSTRRSDLILRGGENVYPAEIEAVLDEHPSVLEAAVFGIDHPDLGQEVSALIVLSSPIDEDELRAFVAERVAYYKVPSRWRFSSDPLPRTATGKIVRSGLRG